MASPGFFSMEKLGKNNKVKEPNVKLHSTLQGSRQMLGWDSGNLSFDLATSLTHNPRLMSPSNFRSPSDDELPSFTDDLISFRDSLALEILGPGHLKLSTEESTTGKSIDSKIDTQGYSIPIQVEEADASPRSLSQMLNSDHQLMFFPETKFITTADDDDDDDEKAVSNASDSASSKLNWSLSASFSSLNSDASRGHSGSSSDGSSPEVFAKRRRKRRKTALPSSQSSSSRSSWGDSLPDTHPGSRARLSQCSEEVSGILADAPATPNFHESDAECSSGSPLSTHQDSSTTEEKNCGSLFQPLSTKVKHEKHPVTFLQNTSIRYCRKPTPRRLTVNLNQNEPSSSSKNVHSDKLFKKLTQREVMWEKENLKGSLFRPRSPRNLSGHRIPVQGCNFNMKTDSNLNSTTAFENAWPALLKTDQNTTNPKESLLRDPAVLTVGEVVQRTQRTNKSWDSSGKAWFRLENVSDLFNSSKETPAAVIQQKLQQLLRSNNKSAFGTLLEDPAVLYACRDNGQNTTDHHPHHQHPQQPHHQYPHQPHHHRASHHQTMRGNHALKELIVWAACGNTSLPNDPAIIAVGKPLLPAAHTGRTTGTVQF